MNTHCIEKLSVSPSRMIGLCLGLVECGMRNTLSSRDWNSLSVASSLMRATTICQFVAMFVCSMRTRSPFSTHFLSMESPSARRKKYFLLPVTILVDTGISVSIFSSANIGIPQAIAPMSGILRTAIESVWREGEICMWSWESRYIHHLLVSCSSMTDIERGDAYPSADWSARTVSFSPCAMNSFTFWRTTCSLFESFSTCMLVKF